MSLSQVSLDSTQADYTDPAIIEAKMRRIEHLEAVLKNGEGDVEAKQKIQCQLVEHFADVFIGNPHYALSKSFNRKMWYLCFYNRINVYRSTVQKRKRKRESVDEIKKLMDKFLGESIKMYIYLIEAYMGILSPEVVQSQESQFSQNHSYDLTQSDFVEKNKYAVVAGLYKFEINIGDLYRYKEDEKQSLVHYERAILLAPVHGNSYNQIGVISQQRDNICNALYWYARSIKTKHPFETSFANTMRLFNNNRRWLAETAEGDVAPLGVPTKKAAADFAKAKKTAAVKRFSAMFVDLQLQAKEVIEGSRKTSDMLQDIDTIVEKLESLLTNSSLGDTLLNRMVVINGFTVSNCNDNLSQLTTLRFGTSLIGRVELGLKKWLDAASNSNAPEIPSSLRGLSPLLLTADFASSFKHKTTGECQEQFVQAEKNFWTKVCGVATTTATLVERLSLNAPEIVGKKPREYKDFAAFAPFQTFIDEPDEYVSFDEAKEMVPQMLHASKKLTQDSALTPLDTRIKLAHLLSIMNKSAKVICDPNGAYRFAKLGEQVLYDVHDDSGPITFDDAPPPAQAEATPDADLLYKAPEHGAGPALLVPGMLLTATADTPEAKDLPLPPAIADFAPTPMQESPIVAAAPVAMLTPQELQFPTPNTATPAALPTPMSSGGLPTTIITTTTVTPLVAAPPPPGLGPSPGLKPPPGLGFTPVQHKQITQQLLPPGLGDIFAKTANPFADAAPPGLLPFNNGGIHNNNGAATNQHSFAPDVEMPPVAGLLDSSLLQSLLLDDSNQPVSKNPFLT